MEGRYRQLFENANDVIYTTDLEHNVTALNKAGEELTGYRSEEVLGKSISLIIPEEYLLFFEEMKERMLAGQPAAIFEIEALTRDGERFSAEVSTRLIIEEGVPVGIQGVLRDVSERKRLEEQLWLAQKMEAVGQLAGGIAHDFNNILTIILGYTDLSFDHLTAEHPAYRNIEGIRKTVDRATSLTRQLLAFSRRQVLRPRVVHLNTIIVDLQHLLARLIGEDVEMVTDLDPGIDLVRADPGQIEQVLMNLVINARDAMPDGGRITIRTANAELTASDAEKHRYVQPGSYVLIEVNDTGHGMDAETMARMFEPFFTTKEAGKGTGLGLSTVYGIIKQSGGYIWAASGPNLGTTFHVYLPRTNQPCVTEEPITNDAVRTPRGQEVVLLVEDEDELRLLLAQTLRRSGYIVLEAEDGSDALKVAQGYAGPIHVVVTDMVMPRMGGRSLVQQLLSIHHETKVVYMSGYINDAAIRRDGLDSETHFLQKPFEPHYLAAKIREVLDQKMAS